MQLDFLDIILGFFEGFALIISPCILPILPIILAGSFAGSKKRPIGIIIGFVITFTLFAFFSRQFVQYSGIDINIIRHFSYGILLLLGIMMLSTYLTEKFSYLTQRLLGISSAFSAANNPQGGLLSGFFFGGLVAIIWTPCAGPILAAIIVQTVIQQTTIISFLSLLAFGLGAAIPMLIIALYGKTIIDKLAFFKTRTSLFRKILGAIIIASVAYMIYQERGDASSTATVQTNIQTATTLQNGLWLPYKAPPISGIEAWINSAPLQLTNLKGKVILVDFWTYSCINCIRTLPYLNNWYNKYHDKGLVIIGVHSPEFDFEKNLDNVKNAVKRNDIKYPVALDNQFVTWRNFNNHYWPAHYLINKKGKVVYKHLGEGDYDITENNIRFLLGVDGLAMPTKFGTDHASVAETPETYLGYARANRNYSPYPLIHDQPAQYTFPQQLTSNSWGLQGIWQVMPDKIISTQANAAIRIQFNARKVFIVMGNTSQKPIRVKLLLNGRMISTEKGKDVFNSSINVNKHSIYELVVLPHFADGLLQLTATEPGLAVYTFTFSS